jgi:hypothetical protein
MLITYHSPIRCLVSLLATVALTACTTPGGTTDHGAHHPGQSAASAAGPGCGMMTGGQPGGGTMGGQTGCGMMGGQTGGGMMGGQTGGGMMGGQTGAGMMGGTAAGKMGPGGMDTNQMCAMYRSIQNAPADQRQAMMDQHMKGMSAEMRQQHMEMMRQQCK